MSEKKKRPKQLLRATLIRQRKEAVTAVWVNGLLATPFVCLFFLVGWPACLVALPMVLVTLGAFVMDLLLLRAVTRDLRDLRSEREDGQPPPPPVSASKEEGSPVGFSRCDGAISSPSGPPDRDSGALSGGSPRGSGVNHGAHCAARAESSGEAGRTLAGSSGACGREPSRLRTFLMEKLMLENLKEAIFGKPGPPHGTEFVHPQLGTLRFNRGAGTWEAQAEKDGQTVTFWIGGELRPDEDLVQRALELLTSLPQFTETLRAFLAAQAETRQLSYWKEDIAQLEMHTVSFSLNDPRGFTVYFHDLDAIGFWRCEYTDGEPCQLVQDT